MTIGGSNQITAFGRNFSTDFGHDCIYNHNTNIVHLFFGSDCFVGIRSWITEAYVPPGALGTLKGVLSTLLGSKVFAGRLDYVTLKGPSQPKPFCDSLLTSVTETPYTAGWPTPLSLLEFGLLSLDLEGLSSLELG